ncbi:MAG TPA: TraR/DksA C4-type zinc finger protein [Gemmatimonadaceae bacterium]|nr:TraR/DksA C4-type zinc finger protein [Gemmatimonadaceae bacterium]
MSPTSGKPLTQKDRDYFEKRLQDERRRALQEMGEMGRTLSTSERDMDGTLSSIPFHMADKGSETNEREQGFLFASREGRLIWHIEQALRRLYGAPETFGVCDECSRPISFERLDAIPYVTRCVQCKQNWEGGSASSQRLPVPG